MNRKVCEVMKDNLIETITKQIAQESANKIDETIIKFCEKHGYGTIKSSEDLIKVQNELAKEDKMIRCEVFCKNIEQSEQPTIGIKQIVIPFIDSISCPISRNAIQEMFDLKDWY